MPLSVAGWNGFINPRELFVGAEAVVLEQLRPKGKLIAMKQIDLIAKIVMDAVEKIDVLSQLIHTFVDRIKIMTGVAFNLPSVGHRHIGHDVDIPQHQIQDTVRFVVDVPAETGHQGKEVVLFLNLVFQFP